jgi:hypothetical protein
MAETAAWPAMKPSLAVEPTEDGALVEDAERGLIHVLNATAAYVLSLCDGRTSPQRIALRVQEAFALAEPPDEAVREILDRFADAALTVTEG